MQFTTPTLDHDRLFKELLSEFFFEFLDLFFPTLSARVDRSRAPVFLDKESFGEPQVDSRREMDLVARLVHLEHQGQDTGDLPARMFRYFNRLWDRYQLPIYPIALLSFAGRMVQPQGFSLHFTTCPPWIFATRRCSSTSWTGGPSLTGQMRPPSGEGPVSETAGHAAIGAGQVATDLEICRRLSEAE